MPITVDAWSIKRILAKKVVPDIEDGIRLHQIYTEGDLQSLVYCSILRNLSEMDADMKPIMIANLRFIEELTGYPDMIVFYHNKPLYVLELKDDINRRVSRKEMEEDFKKLNKFFNFDVYTSFIMISIEDKGFSELLQKHKRKKGHDFIINLEDIERINLSRWRREHEKHKQFLRLQLKRLLGEKTS